MTDQDILQLIEDNLRDNTSRFITPAKHREVAKALVGGYSIPFDIVIPKADIKNSFDTPINIFSTLTDDKYYSFSEFRSSAVNPVANFSTGDKIQFLVGTWIGAELLLDNLGQRSIANINYPYVQSVNQNITVKAPLINPSGIGSDIRVWGMYRILEL